MTQEQYEKSISTGELELSFWTKLMYYFPAFLLIIVPAILIFYKICDVAIGNLSTFTPDEWWFIIVPPILSLAFYKVQKYRLKCRVVETALKPDEIKVIIEQVAEQLKWEGSFTSPKIYEARTNPGIWGGRPGEVITVLLTDNRVLVNSICDPNKRGLFSYGHNKENEDTLADSIQNARQEDVNTPFPASRSTKIPQ